MHIEEIKRNATTVIPQRLAQRGLVAGAEIAAMSKEAIFEEASTLFDFLSAAAVLNDEGLTGGDVLPEVAERWGALFEEVGRRNVEGERAHSAGVS